MMNRALAFPKGVRTGRGGLSLSRIILLLPPQQVGGYPSRSGGPVKFHHGFMVVLTVALKGSLSQDGMDDPFTRTKFLLGSVLAGHRGSVLLWVGGTSPEGFSQS